ncbi:MAG: hypothetical protein ACFFFB_11465 [Candidatus Heimdallarchaeota archaeon]
MKNKIVSDDELEEELEKAFKANEAKKDVFRIIKDERESLAARENRIKRKIKPNFNK